MFQYTLTLVTSFLLFNTASLRRIEEPSCSKFDFEEKVLEKLIKLEIRVENELQRFRDEISKLSSTLAGLTDSVAETKQETSQMSSSLTGLTESMTKIQQDRQDSSDMQSQLSDAIKIVESNITMHQILLEQIASRDSKDTEPVLFVVHSPPTSLDQGEAVVYKTEAVNYGMGYSNSTGKFTAYQAGVYIFSAQMCTFNHVRYQIVVDGTPYSSSYDGSSGVCTSVTTTALISRGDKVWVKVLGSGVRVVNTVSSWPTWNMFVGTLINAVDG